MQEVVMPRDRGSFCCFVCALCFWQWSHLVYNNRTAGGLLCGTVVSLGQCLDPPERVGLARRRRKKEKKEINKCINQESKKQDNEKQGKKGTKKQTT